jgi:hypothetical protein
MSNYAKPQILTISAAISTIMGPPKPFNPTMDSEGDQNRTDTGAYQADE